MITHTWDSTLLERGMGSIPSSLNPYKTYKWVGLRIKWPPSLILSRIFVTSLTLKDIWRISCKKYWTSWRTQFLGNFDGGPPTAREGDEGIDCSQQPKCEVQLPLFQVRNQNARMEAYRQQRERCVARHFQVCLALKQFDHLFNISSQLYQNFERVKAKFMRAVDYVEETHAHAEFTPEQGDRVKRYVRRGRKSRLAETEIVSIRATLGRLARWGTPWCSEKYYLREKKAIYWHTSGHRDSY